MAESVDKATEARRKALRNGEEDPVIVAQRFLNIYRQRHIFSAERKAAFDKMLLELSPEIRGLFSSLPGGIMLQDYVDELAEKNGVAKSVAQNKSADGLNPEAHQQAQILATALAQSQVLQQPSAAAPAGGKISLDKDFAGEFARIMGGVMQQQSNIQKESLEKLALDLSKTQIFIAKTMKEDKEERQSEIDALCKSLSEEKRDNAVEKKCEVEKFYQEFANAHQADREEQRKEIAELCKTIAQSQTALISSLSNLNREKQETSVMPQQVFSGYDDITKKLIEAVLDGQKQLNSRLDKVEELSVAKANDNQQMLAVFEKSQAEIIKTLASVKAGNTSSESVQISGSEEKLAKIISESQEKLVTTLLSANLQQNNMAQSSNNANNIQITAPDNSAQLLLLVDKIASLQASNEENLEKAITKAIEEQGRLFDKISRQQTRELAEMIAESIKEAGRPVVYTMPVQPVSGSMPPQNIAENLAPAPQAPVEEVGHIPPKMDEFDEFKMEIIPDDAEQEPVANNFSFEEKTENEVSRQQELITDEAEVPDILEPVPDNDTETGKDNRENDGRVMSDEITETAEEEPVKKKKKRKKKKKKKTLEADVREMSEEPVFNKNTGEYTDLSEDFPEQSENGKAREKEELFAEIENIEPAIPELKEPEIEKEITENIEPEESQQADKTDDFWSDLPEASDVSLETSNDDWGFGSVEPVSQTTGNDNQPENPLPEEYSDETGSDNEEFVEAIGDNSYIYSSDSYSQEKIDTQDDLMYGSIPEDLSVHPIIIGLASEDDDIDPYQNSILKD